MNKHTFDIEDYVQYRLNLDRANKEGKATWEIAYTFKEYYGIEKVNVESSYKLVKNFYVLNPVTAVDQQHAECPNKEDVLRRIADMEGEKCREMYPKQ